jgi:hypothetical protein
VIKLIGLSAILLLILMVVMMNKKPHKPRAAVAVKPQQIAQPVAAPAPDPVPAH